MKKLGVLVLSEPRNGGSYQYTLSMLEALKLCKELNVTLYTNFNNPHYDSIGFYVNHVHASPNRWPAMLLKYFVKIKAKDPFHEENIVLAPMYSPLLLLTQKPFIYTLHDLQEHHFPKNFSFFQRTYRKGLNYLLLKKAYRIICESEFVREDIKLFFGVAEKKIIAITAAPIEISSNEYSPVQLLEIKTKYSLPEQYIFYPAQFWVHKNHIRLVEAFASIADQFPEASLVFTGQKSDHYEHVFKRVAELDLSKRVIHTGYVDQSDLSGLYISATVLVMPSLFESVSIPIYEAFQYEVAVCSSNVVALPEQVGDAGLLFDPLSTREIGEAISKLLGSEELRKKFTRAGKLRLSEMT